MVMIGATNALADFYNEIVGIMPDKLKIFPPLIAITLIITAYSIFIWFFYKLMARRDMVKIDFSQYGSFENSGMTKFLEIIFYILKFIIISPAVIFLWFSVFSILLIILAKEIEVGTVILISAGIISAIRLTSYFRQSLSQDLSKLFPFTLLGVIILTPGFLDIQTTLTRISQIPLFFDTAVYYLLFIIGLEALLRIVYLFYEPFAPEENHETKQSKKG